MDGHFSKFPTSRQNGLVRQKSTVVNVLSFLQKVHNTLDVDSSFEIVAFYTEFSKAFDKVPHFEILCKVAEIGVEGCILEVEVLVDYLTTIPTRIVTFSEAYLIADDLKVLLINRAPAAIQRDLHSIKNLISRNKIEFAVDKYAKTTLRSDDNSFNIFDVVLNSEI